MRMFSIAILVTVFELTQDLQARPGAGLGHVPFSLDERGAVMVPVYVDGLGPFTFMVDTGASRSAISDALAARVGAPIVARSVVVAVGGSRPLDVARVSRLSVGSASTESPLVIVTPRAELRTLGLRVDGILGQNFLTGFNYTLDYEHRTLIWDEPERKGDDRVRLSLRRDEGRWLVRVPGGERDTEDSWFLPDSGASTMVVFRKSGRVTWPVRRLNAWAMIGSLTGDRLAGLVLTDLRVGGVTLRDMPAVVVDRSEADAPSGDGILPLHIFDSVSFNQEAAYMIVRRR